MQNNQFSSIYVILTVIIYLLCLDDTGLILCMALHKQALVWLIRPIIICLFSCMM